VNVETIPALGDNLIYLLTDGGSGVVVDPGDSKPVASALSDLRVTLDLILVTHTHFDHTGGCKELKRLTRCRVLGPAGTPGLDEEVAGGDAAGFADTRFAVIAVPGHTREHIAYYDAEAGNLFTGDTLFAGGCGRVLGGSAPQMWASLKRLRELPGRTRIYGGHDYALENMTFAAELEPSNEQVRQRLACEQQRCQERRPLVAATLAEEERTNPFLRCDDAALAEVVGLPDEPPERVFAEIRGRKDRFRF